MRILLLLTLLTAPISALADDVKKSLYSLAQVSASMYVKEYHGARAADAEPYIKQLTVAYTISQQRLEWNQNNFALTYDHKKKRAFAGFVIPLGGN